ncbi:MAG: methyltransferase domain-containing protein [Eubacteriales bacterium]|nr:methyltransferase domain-containing protein [Eubacteriales bacterium]
MQTITSRWKEATSIPLIKRRLSAQQKAALRWAMLDDNKAVLDLYNSDTSLIEEIAENYSVRACSLCGDVYTFEKLRESNVNFECMYGRANDIPWRDKTFDMVFLTESGDMYLEPESVANELHRIIKDGGELIISLPIFPFVCDEIPIISKSNRDLGFSKNKELMDLLKNAGFDDVSIRFAGVKYAVLIARKS